jgi:hypothetical protein
MIKCPSCAHENVDGTQFCEMCGEELPQASATPAHDELIICLDCGHENPADNLVCEACGADIQANNLSAFPSSANAPEPDPPFIVAASAPAASTPAPDFSVFDTPSTTSAAMPMPMPAPAAIPASTPASTPAPAGNLAPGLLKLVVEQGQSVGAQFVLGDAELLVGREDEDEEIYPDIDLSDQDAGYVHRKHATLTFDNGNLFVTHLGGSNKTRVNNKPVADNVPTPVKPGDKIGFGKVVLRLLPA